MNDTPGEKEGRDEEGFHMSPDEFRRHGHEVVEWIARYLEQVESWPTLSTVEPGWVRRQLPESPPERGEPFERVLEDVERIILPGVTHWQSPNFFAYFPSNSSGPSILGELLSAGLGVQGMLWATSPACTELETQVLDWMARMMDLPAAFRSDGSGGGVIQDTASSATLCAVLAAREKATGYVGNHDGAFGELTAYTSSQAHSSVEKAIRIAGIGDQRLRLIDVDAEYAMLPDHLEFAMLADQNAGRSPFFVCATVGTTSSNAIDPLRRIGEICRRHGTWLHVDAAMSGTAAVCPEFRGMLEGLELAQSYCFNPHKWMFVNFDCDCFYVASRECLIRALSILPEYLKNQATASGAVIDYRDWQIPLGRRFRALKLWFVIRHYGVEGLRFHIRKHVRMARELTEWIEADADFEVVAPVPLNLVCFRHKGGEQVNRNILDTVNASGRMYMTHTRLGGELTLRMSVAQTHTEPSHVREAWRRIQEAARQAQ